MSKTQAVILLIFVFAARGTSFLFSKELMDTMSPMNVLAVRFLLAFLILALLLFKKLRSCDRRSLRGGLILGVLYTVCMILEMYGLRLVDSGTSALIENMAIVMVPIYAAVLTKTLPKKKTMLCAVLAVVGVGFLSMAQSNVGGSLWGIVLIILAALTYAACIKATEKVSRNADPIAIGVIQLGVMGILSLLIVLPSGGFASPQSGHEWLFILFLVLICSCFGFAFQPLGQKYVTAETAAILTVINPLTACTMGIIVAGEALTVLKVIGIVLILFALILYNLDLKKRKEKKRHEIGQSKPLSRSKNS